MTSFGGRYPYFWLCLLFTWQDLQDLTYLRMVVRYFSSTSRISLSPPDVIAQGVGGYGGTT